MDTVVIPQFPFNISLFSAEVCGARGRQHVCRGESRHLSHAICFLAAGDPPLQNPPVQTSLQLLHQPSVSNDTGHAKVGPLHAICLSRFHSQTEQRRLPERRSQSPPCHALPAIRVLKWKPARWCRGWRRKCRATASRCHLIVHLTRKVRWVYPYGSPNVPPLHLCLYSSPINIVSKRFLEVSIPLIYLNSLAISPQVCFISQS